MIELVGFVVLLLRTVSRAENITCSSECSTDPTNTTEPCNMTSGECLFGCIQGYAGPNCSVECPSNCCNQGYAGTNCSVKCLENCAPSHNSGVEICNATSTECLYGCEDGFYGSYCNKSCSEKVKNCEICTEKTDYSFICDKCERNFYRRNTSSCISCPYYCHIIHSRQTCNGNDGYCEFGCKTGYLGYKCDRKCSSSCAGACHRESGHCLTGCRYTSKCGPTCETACQDGCASQNCNQSCNCVKGCNNNYWGIKCEKFCSTNCQKPENSPVCDSIDGTCLLGCEDNRYWSNQCISCSSGCVNRICEKESGNCTDGCMINKIYGGQCNLSCSNNCLNGTCERADGYCNRCVKENYGRQCERTCNVNCIDNMCERLNGSCVDGCRTGFYGDQCDKGCSDKCFDKRCERIDGNCTDGCVSGYEGFHCLNDIEKCTDGTDNCHANAVCTNTVSSFICICQDGYSGDGTSCTDIDECTEGTDNCHLNADCANTVGSFICTCQNGYSGDGTSCDDLNDCIPNPCQNGGTCVNEINMHACKCVDGYDGNICENNINECASNPCQNCGTCFDGIDKYICDCSAGYDGVNCQNSIPTTDICTCNYALIGGAVCGWFSFAASLVVFIVILVRRGQICKGSRQTDAIKTEEQIQKRERNEYITLQRQGGYANTVEYETLDLNTVTTTCN